MFSLMVPKNRLFSLHCWLLFASFLITNLITRTRRAPAFPLFSLHLRLILASLFLFHFCMQRRGLFPIFIEFRVFEMKGDTRLHLKISLIILMPCFFCLSLFSNYFKQSCAQVWFSMKMLAFSLFFFIFHKCRFSSSLFFLIFCLSCVLVSFILRGIVVHFAVALDYGERAFTTRSCANIFYVFKVWCSYVDSLSGISAGNIMKCCF